VTSNNWLEFGGDPAEVVRFRVRATAALAEVYAVSVILYFLF